MDLQPAPTALPPHTRWLCAALAAALTACSAPRPEPDSSDSAPAPRVEARAADASMVRRSEPAESLREAPSKRASLAGAAPAVQAAPEPAPLQGYLPQDAAYTGITTRSTTPHPVKRVAAEPVSTFSIDVDTGSYSSVRGLLRRDQAVPHDAVRVEEMLNYFGYDYPRPDAVRGLPFAVHTELSVSPWNRSNHVLKIGIQAADPAKDTLPPANLVFLVDVSGSMGIAQSLPLVKEALLGFVDLLRESDRVSVVTYSGATQVLLASVPGDRKDLIRRAISSLQAGGSTAGASGLRLAYEQARRGFVAGGINRILLATDGDFNVGVTDIDQLKEIVAAERKAGVGLSTLGVGHASYNDALMEQIADVGDGKYSFLDSAAEGRKVLVDEFTSTLATVARDVKLQVEFNPAVVKEYRLIGYDNRQLAREDFNNDQVDAGDVGAGHRVTALYELTLHGQRGLHDDERYPANRPRVDTAKGHGDELGYLKIRYKTPEEKHSRLIEQALTGTVTPLPEASPDFRFAMAVAAYGQLLQGSPHLRDFGWDETLQLAADSLGPRPDGERHEFIELARRAARRAHQASDAAPVAISR
ncbi:VWA domain-containing protein [Schlegelella sp. S2-27]|uniref:VWA domain-containing protein n=1 Tax=Caldimonas mangrovi TaxID=2944811 RepID=A0ABT0YGZ7_9BURK|nr:VWA domain-containing protein [Caldimonas mangrovi]MCM5678005.1 VWA domain-containing protein [Caldimonas mangrovi]